MEYHPGAWHVVLVQDCNLRCSYCVTGSGRFGMTPCHADANTRTRIAEMIASCAAGREHISIELGGGETLMRCDEAMHFVDQVRQMAAPAAVGVSITTNGTVASEAVLEACLARGIALVFSIDGPAEAHDAMRRDHRGGPTHDIATQNWRRYRAMCEQNDTRASWRVHSVIAGATRLRDVARYWAGQDVHMFEDALQNPGRYRPNQSVEHWQQCRARYMEDLREIARSESQRLRRQNWASDYRGPSSLYKAWQRLDEGGRFRPCAAGHGCAGVDAQGLIYPCEGFIGERQHAIGDVWQGVDAQKLSEFCRRCESVRSSCNGCWARFLCGGGCVAASPRDGVVLDYAGGCEFSMDVTSIAVESFHAIRR